MSSFSGQSLAALGVFSSEELPASTYFKKFWLEWLIVIASAPDIDHILRALILTVYPEGKIRITHSILGSLMLPFGTILLLTILGFKRSSRTRLGVQVIIAGLSHLVLDLLTGVNELPLLWPFSLENFKLPFGLLPSAGKVSLLNYYLYRNLFIEVGVLAPLFYSIYLIRHNCIITRLQKIRIIGLLLISICFMFWSFSLSR